MFKKSFVALTLAATAAVASSAHLAEAAIYPNQQLTQLSQAFQSSLCIMLLSEPLPVPTEVEGQVKQEMWRLAPRGCVEPGNEELDILDRVIAQTSV